MAEAAGGECSGKAPPRLFGLYQRARAGSPPRFAPYLVAILLYLSRAHLLYFSRAHLLYLSRAHFLYLSRAHFPHLDHTARFARF